RWPPTRCPGSASAASATLEASAAVAGRRGTLLVPAVVVAALQPALAASDVAVLRLGRARGALGRAIEGARDRDLAAARRRRLPLPGGRIRAVAREVEHAV